MDKWLKTGTNKKLKPTVSSNPSPLQNTTNTLVRDNKKAHFLNTGAIKKNRKYSDEYMKYEFHLHKMMGLF